MQLLGHSSKQLGLLHLSRNGSILSSFLGAFIGNVRGIGHSWWFVALDLASDNTRVASDTSCDLVTRNPFF